MNKEIKYIYNAENCSYDLYHPSRLRKWMKVGVVVLLGMFFFFSYFHVCNNILKKDTIKTAILEKKNKVLLDQIDQINTKMSEQSVRLGQLQERDNYVYRPVFGMDEIPQSVRNAGFGGVDRYSHLNKFINADFIIASENKMDILIKKAYVQSLSFDDVQSLSARAGDMANCVPTIYPVVPTNKMRLSSSFGYRSDPLKGSIKFHSGIDIAGPKGTEIYSTGDGVVIRVKYNYYGYGNVVEIDHGFGYVTRYGHLLSASVVEGQRVHRGDVVGKLGNSGRSTGPHLHYEVIYKNKAVNPWNFFSNDVTLDEYMDLVEKSKTRG